MTEERIVIELTDDNFEELVVKAKLPVVVDCYAVWCGPCRMLSPIIDELAGDYKDKINVYKIDVDRNPKTAEKFNVMSIPTVLYFKDGEKVMVETLRGSVGIKAKVTKDIMPGVVNMMHGWDESNANVLTNDDARDPITGFTEFRVNLCRIKKIQEREGA